MADALTAENAPAAVGRKSGSVTLVRHGEPAQSRKIRLNAAEYRDWWAGYEIKGIKPGQTPPAGLKAVARDADVVIASIRPRSIETANAICGDKAFAQDPMFVEAPLPPPGWPDWLRLSPKIWGFLARLNWVLTDKHDEVETHRQAERRAAEAAERVAGLADEGQDVLVVAHGYFNQRVGAALKRRGWRCVEDQGFRYWCARKFERAD
ncbi:MAG: histidine phosphatase family protein [Caulobacter sp.]|nr:histidine phosphatase family protein [Caulobacter sp.]